MGCSTMLARSCQAGFGHRQAFAMHSDKALGMDRSFALLEDLDLIPESGLLKLELLA